MDAISSIDTMLVVGTIVAISVVISYFFKHRDTERKEGMMNELSSLIVKHDEQMNDYTQTGDIDFLYEAMSTSVEISRIEKVLGIENGSPASFFIDPEESDSHEKSQ